MAVFHRHAGLAPKRWNIMHWLRNHLDGFLESGARQPSDLICMQIPQSSHLEYLYWEYYVQASSLEGFLALDARKPSTWFCNRYIFRITATTNHYAGRVKPES